MRTVYKKLFTLLSVCLLLFIRLSAQQSHFIYLQTENKQPFYVRLDKKILSSSVSGYVIIPKLQDGKYELTIGFPKNEWPELNVTCTINKKDAGYLVRQFGSKGWGLFNLQTMEVIMPEVKSSSIKAPVEVDKTDMFSTTLSAVLNDPSIAKKTEEPEPPAPVKEEAKAPEETKTAVVEKKEEAVPVTATPVAVKDSPENKVTAKTAETIEIKPEAKPATVKEEPPVISAEVKKLFSVKSSEGTDLVYADIVNGKADTIRLFVPAEKNTEVMQQAPAKTVAAVTEQPREEPVVTETKPEVKEEKKTEVVKEVPKAIEEKQAVKEETPKNEVVKEIPKPVEEKQPAIKEAPKKNDIVKEVPKVTTEKQPATKEETQKTEQPAVVKKEPTKKKPVAEKNDPKFINIELPNPNTKKDSSIVKPEVVAATEKKDTVVTKQDIAKANTGKPMMMNSDCKSMATEDDFLKLRKKLVAEENEEEMVNVAKKSFRSKCFTTAQVKNLSILFLKDEGKYKFFDSAYPFVSDTYNFSSLESQLTDAYFINRFKAMIHH